jgi:hypothetical protein
VAEGQERREPLALQHKNICIMLDAMNAKLPVKITVNLQRRGDGGLYVWSDDVPGFVLSHSDPQAVLADVKPALEGILSHMLNERVVVEELHRLREAEANLSVREYAAHAA